ncbi:MAG TPA: hypothetical protein VLF61_00600 [Rhabdochlamydiaceae bacterium]|nr:hypothetical protein [Rhabdochlamydiaceae bacterium]
MIFKILFTLLLFLSFFFLTQRRTDGFALYKIGFSQAFNPAWDTDMTLSEEELKEIFNQPFDYLAKGAQTYAFVSRDGRYVIKFFRYLNKYATPLEFLPLESVRKTAAKRKGKLQKDFSSYKIAFEQMKEETGLLYLHLNPTRHLKRSITLYDKMKPQYKLSLDEFGFILQKRAAPFYPTLTNWIEENKTEEAKQALTALVHLIAKRCVLGIFDKDPDLATNFGFLEETPIQFDIGRFKVDEAQKNLQALPKILKPLEIWLSQKAPELATYLNHEISQAAR